MEVQSILLVPLSDDVPPGSTVDLRVTLEARRGSDVYAVPHARVSLRIVGAPGKGAAVTPESADSGDTGTLTVSVRTGDRPGRTVVAATAGTVSAEVAITTVAPATPTPTPRPAAVVGGGAVDTGSDSRTLLIAGLAAASGGGLAALLASLGRLPGRGRVWGRRGA